MRQSSGSNSHTRSIKDGGFYRAVVVSVDGDLTTIKIPRIGFNDTYEDVPFVGPTPSPGDDVWVSFIENRFGNPIIFTSTSAVLTTGDIGVLVAAPDGILDVVEDTTPQLGGSLDVNGHEITGAIDLHSTGDITMELGDALGVNKVSILDSGGVERASVDSDGVATFVSGTFTTGLSVTGDITITGTGNITVTGTVDGRDVATDGSKLDGIEAGATTDMSASEILTAIKTVDGTTSGLDADLLDGNEASAFATSAQGGLADSALQSASNLSDVTSASTSLSNLGGLPLAGGAMTGALQLPDGAVGTPALTWSLDTDTGVYRPSADTMGFATAGTEQMTLDSAALSVTPQFRASTGSASYPGISFANNTATGMWLWGTNGIAFSAAGVRRLTIGTSTVASTLPITSTGSITGTVGYFGGNSGDAVYIGDDTKLVDINVANTMGVYGQQAATTGGIRYGSAGPYVTGSGTLLSVTGATGAAADAGFRFTGAGGRSIALRDWTGSTNYVAIEGDRGFILMSSPDSVMYIRGKTGITVGVGGNGVDDMGLNGSSITTYKPIYAVAGTLAAPPYAFSADTNTGMWNPVNGDIEFSGNTVRSLYIGSSSSTSKGVWGPQIYANTTALAADVYVDINGRLLRSTSSGRYKRDVESLEPSRAKTVVDRLRPVWFRSLCETDNPDHSHYGLIAEEVAEIDPRLCFWEISPDCTCPIPDDIQARIDDPDDYCDITLMEQHWHTCRIPGGVQYDRIIPHLLEVIHQMRSKLDRIPTPIGVN